MKLLQILIFLTFFSACKNTNSPETPKDDTVEVDTSMHQGEEKVQKIVYYAVVDELRLRKEPGSKGAVVEKIKEGEALQFLNEKTSYTDKIKLRGKWSEEPWLKVTSKKGNEGWVFGGAVTDEAPKEDVTKTPYDQCEADYVKSRNNEAYYNCFKEIVKIETEKDSRYIKKTKTGYQVTLLSGEKVNLVDEKGETAEEAYREYEYRYYMDKLGFFVFRIHRFEGGDYILVNDKFGYATPIYGMPKLSPDKNKVVVVNSDAVAGFEFNGIQLFEFSDNGINTLFEEEMVDFAPHNPVWEDERNISFDFLSPASAQKKLTVKAKLSQDSLSGNWNLSINNKRVNN